MKENNTWLITLVVADDITWDNDDDAKSQIAAAVTHHLHACKVVVIGKPEVQRITDPLVIAGFMAGPR